MSWRKTLGSRDSFLVEMMPEPRMRIGVTRRQASRQLADAKAASVNHPHSACKKPSSFLDEGEEPRLKQVGHSWMRARSLG